MADYLPDDLNELTIIEGIHYDALGYNHVHRNMGPILVRGMWFSFLKVGPPEW